MSLFIFLSFAALAYLWWHFYAPWSLEPEVFVDLVARQTVAPPAAPPVVFVRRAVWGTLTYGIACDGQRVQTSSSKQLEFPAQVLVIKARPMWGPV